MRRLRFVAVLAPLACLVAFAVARPASGFPGPPPDQGARHAPGADESRAPEARAERQRIARERWGIEITSLRLSANGHMLDYRYRVVDAQKAAALFERRLRPYLVHQASGRVLAVPETAKLGPLRNSNIPREGRIYWMFFGNAGRIVQPGDRVTVVIGEFRLEDITVE